MNTPTILVNLEDAILAVKTLHNAILEGEAAANDASNTTANMARNILAHPNYNSEDHKYDIDLVLASNTSDINECDDICKTVAMAAPDEQKYMALTIPLLRRSEMGIGDHNITTKAKEILTSLNTCEPFEDYEEVKKVLMDIAKIKSNNILTAQINAFKAGL